MCCIFTCCGWMVDLIQRAWVFAMSCCISSAVCCAMITSSMSGVALGYNYSLAEYIDLKETNVSVYMKRGIFDDDVAGDMDWRRRGHQPLPLKDDESNLITGGPEEPEQMPLESRRRLENSIVESGDNMKYEGSLMKLTVKPPHPSHTQPSGVTEDLPLRQAMSSFPDGSLDQLKAVQEVINMRKMAAGRDAAHGPSTNEFLDENLAGLPEQARRMLNLGGPGLSPEEEFRRRRPGMDPTAPTGHPARWGIPSGVASMDNWMAPKMSPEVFRKVFSSEDDPPPFLKPGTYSTGPIRPPPTMTSEQFALFSSELPTNRAIIPADKEMDAVRENIIGRKFVGGDIEKIKHYLSKEDVRQDISPDKQPVTKSDINKDLPGFKNENNIEYYEDDSIMKGLPVRKKRSINKVKQPRAKLAAEAITQKNNQGVLTKFKVGKSISNKIADYPILVSKLHFSNTTESNETTSTIKKEERNKTQTVGVAANDHTNRYFLEAVKSVIQSMFS